MAQKKKPLSIQQVVKKIRTGKHVDALLDLEAIKTAELEPKQHSQIANARAVTSLLLGKVEESLGAFDEACRLNPDNLQARLNRDLLEADGYFRENDSRSPHSSIASPSQDPNATKVAVLSFLFNWPSKGGGIVHTVELCDFLQRAGYTVQHIYVRYDPEEIGVVTEPVPFASHAIMLQQEQWNLPAIRQVYRAAVDEYGPDYVIVTDSWNMKPILADAVSHYPYILRLQALECLCPLNNIRLLPADDGQGFKQCNLHQLATPHDCRNCIQQRGQRSGSLHQVERDLAGVNTPGYSELLRKVFHNAHAVLVVNPLTEAMVAPYSQLVKTVTAGMDPSRFPDPWPEDPAPPPDRAKKQILFAGVIDETIKGFHVLHEACQQLWQRRQDFELLVTSDPMGRIDEFTRTVGWQTQTTLPRVMRSVEIVAVPAIAQEALGRTAVEAMAAGRPVVASRLGGLPFTIPDGATGLLAEPSNPTDLAEKLERLLDDAALRDRLGKAGRMRFLEHYAWPVIIEKHYRPLLGEPIKKAGAGVKTP